MADITLSTLIDTFLQEGALDATQKDSIREDLGLKTTDAVTFGSGVFSKGSYAARVALTYGATLTPNCADGLSRSVTMTGDQVINAPTNGVSGMILRLKMLASGADRELTFHADIKKPTGTTYEATVASGSTRVIELEYNGTAWMMIKNLEFVA